MASDLASLIKAQPTVMTREEAEAALASLLDRAEQGGDPVTEMAPALRDTVEHLSDSSSPLSPEHEQRLLAWMETHWTAEPIDVAGALCSIAEAMPSEETTVFLKGRLAEAESPVVKELVQDSLTERVRSAEALRQQEAEAAAAAELEAAAAKREAAEDLALAEAAGAELRDSLEEEQAP